MLAEQIEATKTISGMLSDIDDGVWLTEKRRPVVVIQKKLLSQIKSDRPEVDYL